MTLNQFRRRTSQLQLPQAVYKKYEIVVKKCQTCMDQAPAPSRSRVTGLRAEHFGDLLFMDHCEVKINGKLAVFLILLDGATHLMVAKTQASKKEDQTQEQLRIWMDTWQCIPKSVCDDEAFFTPTWQQFYKYHGIKTLPLGPRTPWPNRAETAVRLPKRQLGLMVKEVALSPELKNDKTITPAQLARKA